VGLEGGCACGNIRYRIDAEPVMTAVCYCRDCQRSTGGSPSHGLLAPQAAFAVTKGEPRWVHAKAESGLDVGRAFCPDCGSPLFAGSERNPQWAIVRVGSLDDPAPHAPQLAIWTASAQPWHRRWPDIPTFERQPPTPG
jgi:hypothetical protein